MRVKYEVMRKLNSEQWNVMIVITVMTTMMMMNHVIALTGPNVCTEKQKYNITKRIKYMAPVSVRSYEWCMAMPPRCSRWSTEMRQLTRLENEERTAELEICCAGYKIKDIKCVPICPNGKTGSRCSLDCPPNKWGPNCVYECRNCTNQSYCSPVNGACVCREGWKGERCDQISMLSTIATTNTVRLLTTRPIPSISTTSMRPSTVAFTTSRTPSTSKITTYISSTISYNTSPIISTTDSTSPTEINRISAEVSEVVSDRNTSTFQSNDAMRTDNIRDATTEMFSHTEEAPIIDIVTSTYKRTDATQSTVMATEEYTIISSTISLEDTAKPSQNIAKTTTTKKFKPKEIWIKPAQKGDSLENKQFDLPIIRFRNATNRENIFTTPKTIVVSIIPTSISTHKRALLPIAAAKESSKSDSDSKFTKSMSMIGLPTSAPNITISSTVPISSKATDTAYTSINLITKETVSTERDFVLKTTEPMHVETSTTNSMKYGTESNVTTNISSSSTSVTRISDSSVTINPTNLLILNSTARTVPFGTFTPTESNFFGHNSSKPISNKTDTVADKSDISVTESIETKSVVTKLFNSNTLTDVTNLFPTNPVQTNKEELNNTTDNNKLKTVTKVSTTTESNEDHTFHLLTEPEHITAVIGDKPHDGSSVNLVHVLSIAGGVMMAVITVAVVIVMVERCRRIRFDDEDKHDGMRMKVVMDNDGPPPPYVRSIFHTPLPEPPINRDKCHYQPISTLDRNLKQFMRPVVVQSISPIMIENFRGILECHYDHLPRRSHCSDLSQCEMRCSLTPSVSTTTELLSSRAPSVCTTVTIDTLKREAKFDEIDSTTSEPLYAEIPCWKPPLEHAVEITNIMNGEAVTEL